MNLPYMKFYVRDWVGDQELRMVSLAARGLWLECLCIMHGAKRPGFLESPNGNPIDDDQLARLIGTIKGSLAGLKAELLHHGIPSIEAETGIWFCRRMVRSHTKSIRCSEAGKRGGGSPLLASSPIEPNPDPSHHSHISLMVGYKGDVYTDDFERFYKSYPNKRKKHDAFKAWHQTEKRRPKVELLLEALEAQKKTAKWAEEDGRFIPYPASWLRAGCWDDDIESMNRGAKNGNRQPPRQSPGHQHTPTYLKAPDGKYTPDKCGF
jgi:hypothetical protein